MAKSIRSKHKRKMRAIKREKNAPKELARLKKCLELAETTPKSDVEMKNTYKVVDSKKARVESEAKQEAMEIEKTNKTKLNPKTFKDENGHYPSWMNPRKIKKIRRKQDKKHRTKGKAW